MSYILGISCYYHDSAAALIKDGNIIAAAQEERFTRVKHDPSFPKNAIQYVLSEQKIQLKDIDNIIFYEKPFIKFERLLETYLGFAPKGFKSFCISMPLWIKEKLFQKNLIIQSLKKIDNNFDLQKKIKFSEHHLSHAASAFYPSPFEEAIILTLDGVGEWATTTVGIGKGNNIKILEEIKFPHSLGLLYSSFTYYLGFKVNSGEYKVMGLAPYGSPKYIDKILQNLVDIKSDGSFRLNMKYFNYPTGLTMVNKNFINLFKKEKRVSETENIEQFHMDIASSIQHVTELIILKITKFLGEKYKIKNLCMAGGVALNCVANGKILNNSNFEKLWIQPASGDAGGALGAAQVFWFNDKKNQRKINIDNEDSMMGSFLGPKFNEETIEKNLKSLNATYEKISEKDLIETVAKEISKKKAVGWFQGRMEFGPRALGSRSIIADPRSSKMQNDLNLKIKFRESFRPFAPSVLKEKSLDYFNLNDNSPYMLLTCKINKKKILNSNTDILTGFDKLGEKRSTIPAVTHVDYSARVQTVDAKTNPKFHALLSEFNKITGCPVLINTSFNIRGEPIVCSIEDSFNCFMGTNLDILVIENFILYKDAQKKSVNLNYKKKFNLD
jgi:carbamoyltransferase